MEDVLGVEHPDTEEELGEPVGDDLLVESLIVALEVFEVGREVALWVRIELPSQYYMMMMSSFSTLKNSS